MGSFINSIVVLFVCGVFGAVIDKEQLVSENEGESVTLHTNGTELLKNDKIWWRFEDKGSIVNMFGGKITYEESLDGIFKDRLQILDSQTGSLTIKNIRHKHAGRYEAEINTDTGTTYQRFRVTVTDAPRVIGAEESEVKSVTVGESVTLNTDVQTHRDDLILWRFGPEGRLIAKDDKEDNKSSIYDDVLDGRFRDRLKMDDQTGSLIITNTKTTDTGVYKLKISSNRDTKYKTFSVYVSELISPELVAGIIFGVLLAVVVVGVFSHRRMNYERQKLQVKEKAVFENWSSVTLHTGFTELQSDDVIQWMFRDKVIYTLKKNNMIPNDEGRFRDRLKVDVQTGSLIITNITTQDAGLYKVKRSSSSKVKLFLQFITGGAPTFSQFNVIVTVMRDENNSVTLPTGVTDLQSDDEIQWMFGETLIAEINRKNNTISTCEHVLEGIFRDKLKLDDQTGSLTITDLDIEHTGEYKLKIISRRGTLCSQFKVIVEERIRSAQLRGSVTLNTGVTEIQRDDEIQWRFRDEETLIAQITVGSEPSYDSTDERFRNKLKLNPQTGDLTITNITPELTGVYRAKIINSRGTEYRKYKVAIYVIASRGESVTLKTNSEIQRGSEIQWISDNKTRLVTGKNGDNNETKYTNDERFRDRLKMNHETGDLIITNIRWTDGGFYTLQQISSDGKIPHRIFQVFVSGGASHVQNIQETDAPGVTEKNKQISDAPGVTEKNKHTSDAPGVTEKNKRTSGNKSVMLCDEDSSAGQQMATKTNFY